MLALAAGHSKLDAVRSARVAGETEAAGRGRDGYGAVGEGSLKLGHRWIWEGRIVDDSFHYPPDLFQLLVDTIPKLCKSKSDLLLFFRGAGVSRRALKPYEDLLGADREAFSKYSVTRELLAKLNEQGDAALRVRREVVKRVTEFEDFSVCWESDRAAARGLVAQVRDIVNVKDSFTRMRVEKDEERHRRLEEQAAVARVQEEEKQNRARAKASFYALFGEKDAHKRGKLLEGTLNQLFECYGMRVRKAFTVTGNCSEGIIEQIDGLVQLEGHIYLVEMKWWNAPIGVAEISPHLVRVFSRGGQARGIFVSYTDFTAPAQALCRDALSRGAVVVLATLEEIVSLLNAEGDLREWLKTKVEAAIVDREPFLR